MARLPYDRHRERHHAAPPARRRAGFFASIAAIIVLAAWAGGTTIYILFNDEALQYLVERQVSITRSYEAQAATLQAEVERLRSLKLIDQERVDRAIADLARRQTAIETRQSALNALGAERAKSGGATPETTGAIPEPARDAQPARPANRPSPLSDTILIAPVERQAQLQSRPAPPLGDEIGARDTATAAEVHLANLARDLRRLEVAQSNALNAMEVAYDDRKRRIGKVLDELGLHLQRSAGLTTDAARGSGGPFLPWSRPPDDPFARQVQRVRAATAALRVLEREIAVIPVGRPTAGEAEVTSGFGMRLDPFLRQPAMHTGIDFRGEPGEPVLATAGGKVVQAERNGGYGLMVEIDHGNGLATRYAHLSAVTVSEGQGVAAGDVVGRIGSTGRSTGPHLHYEVRLLGDATDPQRFLRAGLRLHAPD